MESGYSLGSSREGDFGFAFNDSSLSDRVLRIEIMADPPGTLFNRDGSPSLADWVRNRKGHKENIKENDISHNISKCSKKQIFTCDHPASEDTLSCEFHDEAAIARIEEPLSDDEPADSNESNWKANCTAVLSVKALHISSLILAAKSPFFYKLFSNGMKKLGQRHVSLLIFASEEGAFMELLNFMYSNSLTTTAMPALLDILVAADKFEVVSCMKYCSQLLLNFPLTLESALLYLELPSIVIMAEKVQPMTDAAKQFLVTRYRDITKFQDEVLKLPLAGIEAILSSDDLQVPSEDVVYDITLKWTRAQYPKVEDRQEILGSRLVHFIRFPYMTCRKLKKVLTSNDFDPEVASKAVFEALFFKSEALHRRKTLVAQSSILNHCRFVERAYRHRPVKVVEFEFPHQQCVVYLDLKQEECANLFPSGRIYSQAFHLGGQGFFLSAHCNMNVHNSFHCFGLFLGMQEKVTLEKGSVTMLVDYEFAARSKPTNEYVSKYKGSYTFTGGKAIGYRNLFSTPWTPLMAEDSLHFINGILHLRVEVTIRN